MKAILTFLFVLIFASVLFAADKPANRMDNYIAVFDLEAHENVEKGVSFPLTESIRRELVKSGKYEVIDRGNMNKILGEQKFQLSGCVSGQCIVEAGQLLGVGRIIAGSVSKIGKTYYLSLSLINVKTGKIEDSSEDTCKCEVDELIDSSKRLVKRLLGEQIASSAPPEATAAVISSRGTESGAINISERDEKKRLFAGMWRALTSDNIYKSDGEEFICVSETSKAPGFLGKVNLTDIRKKGNVWVARNATYRPNGELAEWIEVVLERKGNMVVKTFSYEDAKKYGGGSNVTYYEKVGD